MNALAVIPGKPKSLHLRADVPRPVANGSEALVRVIECGVCGVCGTDLEIHDGLYGSAPEGADYLVLGHENLGLVEDVPAASGFTKGDLVVCTVRRPCPEACPACLANQNDMCMTGHFRERGIAGLHSFMSEARHPGWLARLITRRIAFTDYAAITERNASDIKMVLDFS